MSDQPHSPSRASLQPLMELEYISLADASTGRDLDAPAERELMASIAVRLGSTRLIDNILLPPAGAAG